MALAVLVVVLAVSGQYVRRQLDLDIGVGSSAAIEASLQELRDWVQTLGWLGPGIFLGLVVFRQFLLLPSGVVLTVGGLTFGIAGGTLLGSIGIVISALLGFSIARGAGRDLLRPRLGARYLAFERRIERAGAWVVALVTAHPAAPMTTVHVAAGLTSIAVIPFLLAVLIAGTFRAGLYAILGSSIVEIGIWGSLILGVGMLVLGMLPLAHRRARAWLFPNRDLASHEKELP